MSNKQDIIHLLFSPEWRVDRMQFFVVNLVLIIVWIGLMFLLGGSMMSMGQGAGIQKAMVTWGMMGLIIMIIYLVMTYISVIITIKRLRDIGLSPWLVLLYLVPIVGFVFFIYLLVAPSKE